MTIELYHCKGARSLRVVWTLDVLGIEYQRHDLPFPPRVFQKEYLGVNRLGTVPYLIDGDVRMTESPAICHYLVERYGPTPLGVRADEAEYPSYLNWLYFSDATLTFPQTLYFRYTQLEPEERRVPQVAEDYRRWFHGRLRAVEHAAFDGGYLCAGRFTIADICIGYSLHFATSLGLDKDFHENTKRYWANIQAEPSYQRIADL